MAAAPLDRVVEVLRATGPAGRSGPSDAELLDRFRHHRDEDAFAHIVRRHGPTVRAATRQVLSDPADLDDVFQAAFVVLFHKVRSVDGPTVGSWLYAVAHRLAVRCRADACRRAEREQAAASRRPPASSQPDLPWPEAVAVLHQELDRMPDVYRRVLLLCYLRGWSREEAAADLGWSPGAVKGRLERGRKRLARRLAQRGITTAAVLLSAATGNTSGAGGPPPGLIERTIRAVAGATSPAVAALARGVMRDMVISKLRPALAVLLLGGAVLATGGLIVAAGQPPAPPDGPPGRAAAPGRLTAEAGRLLLFREGRLASVAADSGLAWHSEEPPERGPEVSPWGVRLSPDGKRAAYGVEGETPEGLPVVEFLTVHVRGLADGSPAVDLGVRGSTWCWSADGTKLLVSGVDRADGEPATRTWVVDVKTKEKVELKLPADHLVTDWSADGAWLLTDAPRYLGLPKEMSPVTLMRKDGTGARRLNPRGQEGSAGRFAPDGRSALYLTFDYGTRKGKVFVANLAGGPARSASPDLDAHPMSACWSPDGNRIASVWRRNNRAPAEDDKAECLLLITDRDGKNEVTVRKDTGRLPADEAAPHRSSWFPLGGIDWR